MYDTGFCIGLVLHFSRPYGNANRQAAQGKLWRKKNKTHHPIDGLKGGQHRAHAEVDALQVLLLAEVHELLGGASRHVEHRLRRVLRDADLANDRVETRGPGQLPDSEHHITGGERSGRGHLYRHLVWLACQDRSPLSLVGGAMGGKVYGHHVAQGGRKRGCCLCDTSLSCEVIL